MNLKIFKTYYSDKEISDIHTIRLYIKQSKNIFIEEVIRSLVDDRLGKNVLSLCSCKANDEYVMFMV